MAVNILPNGLNEIGNIKQAEILDAIDHLRQQGINREVSLPQIIVCGDQSSGKSSVLEAISGVRFPVKASTCTRFPTELILRRKAHSASSVAIVPHEGRSEAEHAQFSRFQRDIDDLDSLESIIEEAKGVMGVSTTGAAFTKDLLRVEITGPNQPHLTIVDLPGLIHSPTRSQTAEDRDLIRDVVRSYMKEPRSIILAVVSAKNDIANQIVLNLASEADNDRRRTLGVITKPDTLTPGSESEEQYVALARNEEFEFNLGWHVLKNRDSEKESGQWDLSKRDVQERLFFSEGVWTQLPSSSLGVDELKTKLSSLLLKHIAATLPSLIRELEHKMASCHEKLEKLGQPRTTEGELRRYLLSASQSFQSLLRSAIEGTYNDPFFGDPWSSEGSEKRLRAVIQNLNQGFANDVSRRGHEYQVMKRQGEHDTVSDSNSADVAREEYLAHVVDLMRRERGRELSGTFNPMIIATLFVEQSRPWRGILSEHVHKVWKAAERFIRLLVDYALNDAGSARFLYLQVLECPLKNALNAMQARKNELLRPHESGHPVTYNHYFTDTVIKMRAAHESDRLSKVLRKFFELKRGQYSEELSFTFAVSALAAHLQKDVVERDMDMFSAREAASCMAAYYKVAMKRLIDDVAVEVVEVALLKALPKIFTPVSVAEMSSELMSQIAGETTETRNERSSLQKLKRDLQQSFDTCKRFEMFGGDDVLGLPTSPSTPASDEDHVGGDDPQNAADSKADTIALDEGGQENGSARDVESSFLDYASQIGEVQHAEQISSEVHNPLGQQQSPAPRRKSTKKRVVRKEPVLGYPELLLFDPSAR